MGGSVRKSGGGAIGAIDGSVVLVSSAGVRTAFKPSADTDIARAAALQAAMNANDPEGTIYLSGNVYDFGSSEVTMLHNSSFIGTGRTVIKTTVPTGADKRGVAVLGANVYLEGITFLSNITDASYGTGHAYNVVFNGEGRAVNCEFVFYSTVTAVDGGKSFKNIVALGEKRFLFKGCTVHSLYVSGQGGFHGAHHAGGGASGSEYVTYENCDFLGENISTMFISNVQLIDCRANEFTRYQIGFINLYQSRSICPEVSRSLMDETKYLKYITQRGEFEYEFGAQVETGADWRTIFQIEDTGEPGPRAYELEISVTYYKAGSGSYYCYYKAVVNHDFAVGGTNQAVKVLEEFKQADLMPTGVEVRVVHNASAPDVFELQERSGGNDRVQGFVKFRPMRRAIAAIGVDASLYATKLTFFDISET